jgi:hypothetical protein
MVEEMIYSKVFVKACEESVDLYHGEEIQAIRRY